MATYPCSLTNFSFEGRFILSNDTIFLETGTNSRIKYLDDFNRYKQFISDNFESPGLVATFARLNSEILGTPNSTPSAPVSATDGPAHDDDEDRMRAELWEENGTPPPSIPAISDPSL